LRGPSGEGHQIQLDGIVERVTLFHGRADEEFDWHVYLRLSGATADRLQRFLRQNGIRVAAEHVARPYCELMLVDDRHKRGITWPPWQASWQWRYDSADLTAALRLSGGDHPAYDLGRPVANEPGENRDLSTASRLARDRGRIAMQGLLVLDTAHDTLEIHPPDSFAFAMDTDGRTLSARPGEAGWPDRTVRWRVAWFANSGRHRVSAETPLQQQRTTAWYLDPPTPAPTLPHLDVSTEAVRLWDSKAGEWYDRRGVAELEAARFAADPRDGQRRLLVSATMQVPGNRGGLVVRDYLIRRRPPVVKPI
jgi:hypothetical protein